MAHFAEIDENNIVTRVVVTDNNHPDGDEGYSWLIKTFGGTWIQTSYNSNFRKHFAGIGFTYDETLDAFIPPKPFESWILDEETCLWQPPIALPSDAKISPDDNGKIYQWDEPTLSWLEVGE